MDAIQRELLEAVSGLHEIPTGAYNIRADGASIERNSTANIEIIPKAVTSVIPVDFHNRNNSFSTHIISPSIY